MTPGATTIATISSPGQSETLSFFGVAGQSVSIQVASVTWNWCQVATIISPDGTPVTSGCTGSGNTSAIGPAILPATGTYRLAFTPNNQSTGTATVTLWLFNNAVGPTLASGTPATATISNPGQSETLSFSGVAGQSVSIQVGNVTWNWCELATIISPDGTPLTNGCTGSGNASVIGPAVLPATGTYTLVFTPNNQNQSTGTATVTLWLFNNAVGPTLTSGTPATATVNNPLQTETLSFSGVAGQSVSIQVGNVTWNWCELATIISPDGTPLTNGCTGSGNASVIGPAVLPATGTYTLVFTPANQNQSTGTATVTLWLFNNAVGPTLTSGTPATATVSNPLQTETLSFSGVAGQSVSIQVGNVTWNWCELATIISPDGTPLTNGCTGSGNASVIGPAVLPATGTYTLVFTPANQNQSTGTATVTLWLFNNAVGPTLTPGTPATATISNPLQSETLSFSGVAGQSVSIQVGNVTWNWCETATIISPDGTSLTNGCTGSGNTSTIGPAILPATGTYTLVFTSADGNQSTGTATVTLSLTTLGVITLGSPTTLTVNTSGQSVLETFSGVAGQSVSVQISDDNFNVDCTDVAVNILNGNGSTLVSGDACGDGFQNPVVLPATGSYILQLTAGNGGTGYATVDLSIASLASVSPLTSGTAASVSISTPGQSESFTFSGTAGQMASFQVSNPTWSYYENVTVLNPDGTVLTATNMWGNSLVIGPIALPASGTYTVVFSPYQGGIATGTANLTVWLFNNVTGSTLTPGTAASVSISTPGQSESFTFSGTAGQMASLEVSNPTWNNYENVTVLNPDGTVLIANNMWGNPLVIGPIALPATGTYTVVFSPYQGGIATGTANLTVWLFNNVTGSTLTPGTPASVSISTPGQSESFTFSGTAGQIASFLVSNPTWSYYENVTVLNPDGTVLTATNMWGNSLVIGPIALPASGTYTVVFSPYQGGIATGTANLTVWLFNNVTGSTLTPGTAASVSISTPGQSESFTFSGTAGQMASLEVSNPTWNNYENVTVLNPDGTVLIANNMWGNPLVMGPIALPATGAYTVVFSPYQGDIATGTANLTVWLYNNVTGSTLTPGTVASVSINDPQQQNELTFAGTIGQLFNLQFSNVNFPNGCGSVLVTILYPDNTVLSSGNVCGSSYFQTPFTLPATGTYSLVISVQNGNTETGTLTVLLSESTPVAAPTFSVVGGNYGIAQVVTLTDQTAGANTYYSISGTSQGSAPTALTLYTGPISVSSTETITAVAIAPNDTQSAISAATYVIAPPTVVLASSVNPITYGGSTLFTASLVGGQSPTGTVTFQMNGTTLGTSSVVGGVATFSANNEDWDIGSYAITGIYSGDTNNSGSTASLSEAVSKATPTITWSTPAAISYGTALGTAQLDALSSIPGTWTYSPAAGVVLNPGSQVLAVTFTPNDASHYASVTSSTTLTVNKGTPALTVATSGTPSTYGGLVTLSATISPSQVGPITFLDGGNPIGDSLINGNSANLSTTSLATGTHTITASWSGNSNYNAVTSAALTQTVSQATTTISWDPPSPITYGTPLSVTQLNAVSATTGTFAYSPPAGSVLGAGTQTISATFTPTDTTDNTMATATVSLVVNQATPVISWRPAGPIVENTQLGPEHLDATANVAGSFVYSPPAGTQMTVGTHVLTTTFTPSDTTDYTVVTSSKTIVVQSSTAPAINTVAGSGVGGGGYVSGSYSGDNGPATSASLDFPTGVALDGNGNVYFADSDNNRIRMICASATSAPAWITGCSAAGIIVTVAGNGPGEPTGDGGPATSATLCGATGVALDAAGNIYIASDSYPRIRMVNTSGIISTIAGTGTACGNDPGNVSSGDGGPAISASFNVVWGIALDNSGNIYIADGTRIREISSGIINTIAGNGNYGSSGDGGPATNAAIYPMSVAVDSSGNVYFAEGTISGSNIGGRVREISGSLINTIAGTGVLGFSGDGGPATSAELNAPWGLAVDPAGDLYITDILNNDVRRVDATSGIISTVAGNGAAGFTGDGGLATSAEIDYPEAVAVSSNGNFYIADTENDRIREVGTGLTGTVLTWQSPLPIPYGTPLSGAQLNAFANTPGTYAYTPSTGVLSPGTYTLTVVFTPTDTTNYTSATASVTLTVTQATPQIVWTPQPTTLPAGAAFGSGTLNAYATNPNASNPNQQILGTFSYSDAGVPVSIGTQVSSVGPQWLVVSFTPTDQTDYTSAVSATLVDVTRTGAGTYDAGTVTLTVTDSTGTSTSFASPYGQNSTATTVAADLASRANGSLLSAKAVDDTLYLEAASTNANTDYTYSIQGQSSAGFPEASFIPQLLTGTLEGGANASASPSLIYSYSAGYDGVSNVTSYSDSVMGSWQFGYDTLNRLTGSQNTGTTTASTQYANNFGCWSYDDFGNRTAEALSATPCNSNPPLTSWAAYASNNQMLNSSMATGGVSYDGAGNTLYDGANQYLYDGDGRICAVASSRIPGTTSLIGYIYDASGNRVAKGSITSWSCDPTSNGFATINDYVVDQSGEQVSEMGMQANNTMAWQHTNVYAAGKLLATYDNDGLHFYITDPLGTRRAQTDYAGVLEQTCLSLPFGDAESCGATPTEQLFTGKERDTESGNDYFGARYYASAMGRFMNPDYQNLDDGDTPEAVYYGATTNPQTLNLYSYGENNPLKNRDYDGHASWQPCANDPKSQCWTGDYNGEKDCSGSGGCLFWNSSTNQWGKNDPTPPPDSPIGTFFGGFFRTAISHNGADFHYGLNQMACGALGASGSACATHGLADIAVGAATRPSFVPKDWIEKPSNKGTGVKWVDPNNPHNSVRLEPAKPGSSNPGQQQDYMVVTKNGQTLDLNGNAVPRQSLDSHIPQGTELPPETFGPIE